MFSLLKYFNKCFLVLTSITLLFLLNVSLVNADSDEEVQELTPDNYDSVVGHEKSVFVKFYAPWCGHCKKLAPIFKEVGNDFSGRDDVIIAQVDANKHRNFLKRYNIRGFPTLLFFPPHSSSSFVKFKGARTKQKMNDFIEQQLDIVKKDEFVGETANTEDSFDSDVSILSVLVLLISLILAIFEAVIWCLDWDPQGYPPQVRADRIHHAKGLGMGIGQYNGSRRYLLGLGFSLLHIIGGYSSLAADFTLMKSLYLVTLVLYISMQLVWLWVPYFNAPIRRNIYNDVENGSNEYEKRSSTKTIDNDDDNYEYEYEYDDDLSLFEPRPGVQTPRISDAVRLGLLATNTFLIVLSLVF